MFNTPFSMIYLIDLIGVGVYAASGALSAGKKGLDVIGVIIISIVTSVGGGTLRDLLLDRNPIFWIGDPAYIVVGVIASFFTLVYVRRRSAPFKALLIVDAFGLAFFTLMGTRIAEVYDFHPLIYVIMGTITGVAGGVFRDILSAEVPLILRRDIYATAAICGSIAYLLLNYAGAGLVMSYIGGFLVVLILRSLAIIKGMRLPVFKLPDEPS